MMPRRSGSTASMTPTITLGVVVILLLASAGCHTTPPPAQAERRAFPSLAVDGLTTKRDTLARLGAPTFESDAGRVIAYRVGIDGKQQLHVLPRNEPEEPGRPPFLQDQYSLVLVFDARGILARHSVVPLFP